ncbi:MAG: cofactor-independent phosphoglycerate mutase, partial [Candidatus Omnitrophica bacterium]|nr:cofactor-independent phosphoglycerate mutase [Candidatus Omnitrophota bacterium]
METIPDGFPAGSEVANLSILGYSPKKYYQGRGVLEAASLGIDLEPDDTVFRCNTVFVDNGIMISHSAGHITSKESKELIEFLNVKLSLPSVKFYHGLDYRHILVLKAQFSPEVECFPPHDNVGKSVNSILPRGLSSAGEKTAETLRYLIKESEALLKNHPVNLKRIAFGKQPGNLIWPWSPGRKPAMEPISKKFGITGAVISAVDLVKGIGIYAGFDVINVKGATGLYNTNYEGKAYAAIEALNKYDLVYVHVEAPDEAAHEGNLKLKIKCIEDFDSRLFGIILKNVDLKQTCIAVISDHFTSVSQRNHSNQKVPFVIYRPDLKPDHIYSFSEKECADGAFGVIKEDMFIKILLGKNP